MSGDLLKFNLDVSLVEEGAKNLGKGALEAFKTNYKKAYESLTETEKKQSAALLLAIGKLRLLEISGADVKEPTEILNDALLQWKAVASGEAVSAFKAVASDVIGLGGQFVSTVLRSTLRI